MSAGPHTPMTASPAATRETSKDERQWAMYAHVAAPVLCIVGQQAAAGLWCFVAPLVIYFIKKSESAFVARHAKEATNFTITLLLFSAAFYFGSMQLAIMRQDSSGISSTVVMIVTTIIAMAALSLYAIAALKALDGQPFRYPITLRLIR